MKKPLRWWVRTAGPAVVVTVPHIGNFPYGDLKDWVFGVPAETGGSFFGTLQRLLAQLGPYLKYDSNFRPTGRLILDLEAWFAWEVASVTGVSPHIISGVIMLGFVAVTAAAVRLFVDMFLPPEGFGSRMTPLLFAGFLVTDGFLHPVLYAPPLTLTVTALTFLIPVWVVRGNGTNPNIERDPHHKLVLWGLLGVAAGFVYELLWLTPALVAVVLVATQPAGNRLKNAVRNPAAIRWLYYTAGTGAAAVTVTSAQKISCVTTSYCGYVFASIGVTDITVPNLLERTLQGLPFFEWVFLSADLPASNVFLTNGFLLILATGLLRAGMVAHKNTQQKHSLQPSKPGALVLTGIGVTAAAAVAGAASVVYYECGAACYGMSGKTTIFSQIGWVLISAAAIHLITTRVQKNRQNLVRTIITSSVLTVLSVTWLINLGYAESWQTNKALPYSSLAAAATNFSTMPGSDAYRCGMLEFWYTDPGFVHDLQQLTSRLHNTLFCTEQPPQNRGGLWDIAGTKYETEQIKLLNMGVRQIGAQRPTTRFALPLTPISGFDIKHVLWRLTDLGWLPESAESVGDDLLPYLASGINRIQVAEILNAIAYTDGHSSPDMMFVDITDTTTALIAETAYKHGFMEPCSTEPLKFCPHQLTAREAFVYGIVNVTEHVSYKSP